VKGLARHGREDSTTNYFRYLALHKKTKKTLASMRSTSGSTSASPLFLWMHLMFNFVEEPCKYTKMSISGHHTDFVEIIQRTGLFKALGKICQA
jgi:hypothetical protein